jgi:hypothetical protein
MVGERHGCVGISVHFHFCRFFHIF